MQRGIVSLMRRYERGRRFWRLVRVAGRDDCWLWEGDLDGDGRPWFDGDRAEVRAYELELGKRPAPQAIEHRCGDPRCVNPEHLRLAPPAP